MDDSKPAPARNPSRTLVVALVAILIDVAIAGIVLAGLRGRPSAAEPSASASPTQQAGVATTAASAPPIEADVGAGPNQVGFARGSDMLSGGSLKKIADMTQGRYFHAASAEDLKAVYSVLSKQLVTETREMEITSFFAAAAALLMLVSAALSLAWFGRVV